MAVVIFKPTEACNSNCVYCDVVAKPRPAAAGSRELLELFYRRLGEFMRGRPDERVSVIWHGGEPLLLGADYFRAARELQDRYCAEHRMRLEHSIQTNLTLVSDGLLDALAGLGITSIGTSFECLPGIRGFGAGRDSRAYQRDFFDGLRRIARRGLGWGFIYVVTRAALADPLGVFRRLANLKPDGGFMLNPVLVYGEDAHGIAISPQEYLDFLGAVFPWWWERRDWLAGVDPFKTIHEAVSRGGASLGCCDSGACADSYIEISPDGRVSHCGRSSDWGQIDYGSLEDRSFEQILAHPARGALAERGVSLQAGPCAGCRFWSICHGGCPLDSFAETGRFDGPNPWCLVRKGFIEQYYEPVSGRKFEPAGGCGNG